MGVLATSHIRSGLKEAFMVRQLCGNRRNEVHLAQDVQRFHPKLDAMYQPQ